MNRVLASFTRSEKSIIAFVMFIVCTGFGLKQWKESRSMPLVFHAAEEKPSRDKSAFEKVLSPTGRIDVNKADAQALETLPGVGPSLAAAIIQYREQNGAFSAMDDLDKVPGIGPALLSKISPLVDFENPAGAVSHAPTPLAVSPGSPPIVSPGPVPGPLLFNTMQPVTTPAQPHQPVPAGAPANRGGGVNINTAGVDELDTLDGIGPALAQRIITDRQVNGRFPEIRSLVRVKGIGVKVLEKNRGRIRVD